MKKKVLILLSTYNGHKYVSELIDSLLRQVNVNVDILIRDDGSKDNTIEIIKKINTKKIKIIEGDNIGCTKSFFELLKQAPINYDYYAFCDQDDVWLENKLEHAVLKLNQFEQNKPSLYYSGQILTDAQLNIISIHNLATNRSIKANYIFNQMAGCTAVFNTKLLEFLKKFTPMNVKAHDAWTYRLCAALGGNILVESKGYIYYRQHENNVVGLKNNFKSKIIRAKNYLFKYTVSNYALEMLEGYEKYIDDDWKKFLKKLSNTNKNLIAKKSLIKDKSINFNDVKLNIIFKLKIILNKI